MKTLTAALMLITSGVSLVLAEPGEGLPAAAAIKDRHQAVKTLSNVSMKMAKFWKTSSMGPTEHFVDFDQDGDGYLTAEEAPKRPPPSERRES